MSVRVRFAPSPTGFLHIGGARTALFNWLYARGRNGTFILRIEDTDTKRSETQLVEGILEGLQWLGLKWDEGPYFQSERTGQHLQAAHRLLEERQAYYCFCSESEEGQFRHEGDASRHACRQVALDEARRRTEREPAVVRFRVPEQGRITFTDRVYGDVVIEAATLEDFALVRSDGTPTYHLSVVVDDIDMEVSHVIRGVDHLSNTSKQILLYQAAGAPLPEFAHLPLILGPDKTRLSKRHGATSVLEYRRQGFLPLAIRNYLARLGWSPKSDQEVFTDAELIRAFGLDGINKANAVLDLQKLEWLNARILGSMDVAELLPLVKESLRTEGLFESGRADKSDEDLGNRVRLLQGRVRHLTDFGTRWKAFFSDDFTYDEAACEKFVKPSQPDWERIREGLADLSRVYASLQPFDLETTERSLREIADERELKAGTLIGALRVALTGEGVAPGIFEVIVTLGRETVGERIARLLSTFA